MSRRCTPEGDFHHYRPRVTFTVPLTPPTVNHYVKHSRAGRHYRTAEAIAWDEAVQILACQHAVRADAYRVAIEIYLGKGEKGDIDNFAKCCLDSLVKAGVICTDAKVAELRMRKARSWDRPRTEIEVTAL